MFNYLHLFDLFNLNFNRILAISKITGIGHWSYWPCVFSSTNGSFNILMIFHSLVYPNPVLMFGIYELRFSFPIC